MKQDSEMLEFLVYALMLWEEKGNSSDKLPLGYFTDILNELLLCDWHTQHENIVTLLQKISAECSVEPLYQAIYSIGGEKAIHQLEILSRADNPIIKEMASRKPDQYIFRN